MRIPGMPTRAYHLATKIRADGGVSALCYDPPRKIDLTRAAWTLRPQAVTRRKCLRLLQETANELGQRDARSAQHA